MSKPRLVVCAGAYNETPYLRETIPSILSQSMGDFALYLVDNGSTDATFDILQEFARQDSRIVLHRSPTNLWPPVATNQNMTYVWARWRETRWQLAHGADDVMCDGYLQAIMDAAAAHPNANCIYSPWQWIGHPEKGVKHFPAFNPETCHEQHQMPAWRAITRELWEAVGPEDETIRIGSDWEWPVRGRYKLNAVQLDRPYISLRVREGDRDNATPAGRCSQSEEVNWRELYRRLCRVAEKPIAGWAC